MRYKFEDLHSEDLWRLRNEIVLNSLFTADYCNTFGFAPKSVQEFFDGYLDYLWELATDEHGHNTPSLDSVLSEYDNKGNLFDYYWNSGGDGYDWFEYDPEWTDEEIEEYENYWNGVVDDDEEYWDEEEIEED